MAGDVSRLERLKCTFSFSLLKTCNLESLGKKIPPPSPATPAEFLAKRNKNTQEMACAKR